MTTTYHRTTDGQQVAQSEALDERGVLRDGHTMRKHLALMDGAPGPLDDEQRVEMIDRYKARVSSAWRDPGPQFLEREARLRDDALAKISDPYERYERRLQDAWR